MGRIFWRTTPVVVAGVAAAVALSAGACSSRREPFARPVAATSAPERPAPTTTSRSAAVENASITRLLEKLGPEGQAFHAHVTTLGNPFFEGRAPGTRGNELAAEYIARTFRDIGLEPAFGPASPSASLAEASAREASFYDEFSVPGDPKVNHAAVVARGGDGETAFDLGREFNPMAISTNGSASGPLVFVGYSIEDGKGGYSSYGAHEEIKGAIALVLRFEPMDEKGRSLWSEDDGWSNAAALLPKIRAAVSRGAAGVILVNAPGADDTRVNNIMSLDNSRIGGKVDVPVVMMGVDAADRLVRAADAEGRSLLDLRRLADTGEVKTLTLGGESVELAVDIEVEKIATNNVGAVLRGRGALADEWVIIGAHYDHIGVGKFSSRSPDHRGRVHAGADDNASGTAGLLTIAERLAGEYAKLPAGADARSVLFVAFSAEEMGLLGAKDFVANPSVPLSSVAAMINMDMIGRYRPDLGVEISGVGTGEGLRDVVERRAAASGLKATYRPGGRAPTDQSAFVDENVPVVGFFTGTHPEYHTVYDVVSTLNFEGGARIARLVSEVAMDIATLPAKPKYVQIGDRSRMGSLAGAQVRLGIAPGNYSDTEPGVLVGAVSPGTTAEKAGLQKGDRIIRWGGEELADVGAMMQRLQSHKVGDRVEIVVIRDGKELPLTLVMQGRGGAR